MKWPLWLGWLLAACLALSSCRAPEQAPLRLGTNVWPGYEPLYLADQLGYYPANSVKMVEYLSASEVIRALRNRSIDAGALTLDETLSLLEHKTPIQVVLVTDVSNGGDAILAKPDISSMAGLAGKRIGVEGTALGAYTLSRALELNELSVDQIEVVQREVSEHEQAYQKNEVDAVVTFEPARTRLLEAGATELFSSREIPGEIVDVIVVHRDVLKERPQQLAALVNGWFMALDYLNNEPRDAAKRMSKRLDMTPEQVLSSYEGLILPTREKNLALLGSDKPELRQTAKRLHQVMLSKKLLGGPVNLDSLTSVVPLQTATP